jgi:hypothetical protein
MRKIFVFVFPVLLFFSSNSFAQDKQVVAFGDSVIVKKEKKDSVAKKVFSPRIAAIRSAILPGLGQIYNKKYWKLPIVYGVLGTTSAIFFYNLRYYKLTRFAYTVRYNMRVNFTDSSLFSQINPNLQPLSEESLVYYRDQFRRNMDYSVLFFLIFWGVNVIDATVDAHLKSFDVSPNLSLRFKAGHSEMAGTNGLSLVLKIGK